VRRFCEFGYEKQKELKKQCGVCAGMPIIHARGRRFAIREEKLRKKNQRGAGHYHTYIESAIRDAHVQGLIHAPDPAAKARMIFAYSKD